MRNIATLSSSTSLEWYYIVLIVLGGLILVGLLAFVIIYLCALKCKKRFGEQTKEYYKQIIKALGGIDNIVDLQVHSSRLSVVLKDNRKLDDSLLDGIGIVKSSRKITLVIGEMAQEIANQIQNQLSKQ